MSATIEGLLWIEKYRPETLEEMALSEENRQLFENYIERAEIPHLLLHGPAGCGKTTVSKILANELDCQLLTLNASSERGIDTIRDQISTFVRGRHGRDWNIVFLDEADALTRDAQTAMRNLMETYSDKSRFILTANYPHRLISPIRDRCVDVGMQEIPLKRRGQVLLRVLKQEGIEAEVPTVMSYAERYTSLRKLLTTAQKSYLSNGELKPAQDLTFTGKDIYEHVLDGNYTALKEMSKSADFDPRAGLVDLFWAVPDDFERRATFLSIIGSAVTDSTYTPDPRVHFLGTMNSLMTEAP